MKAYLIGFEPPGLTPSRVERTRMMQACDFCIWSENGLTVGEVVTVSSVAFPGEVAAVVAAPNPGTRYRVRALESLGKIVELERLPHD